MTRTAALLCAPPFRSGAMRGWMIRIHDAAASFARLSGAGLVGHAGIDQLSEAK